MVYLDEDNRYLVEIFTRKGWQAWIATRTLREAKRAARSLILSGVIVRVIDMRVWRIVL